MQAVFAGAVIGLVGIAFPPIAFITSCFVLLWLGLGAGDCADADAQDESPT